MSCSSHTQSPFIFKPIARLEFLFLLSTILLGTILRFFLLDDKSLWGDEIIIVLRAVTDNPLLANNALVYRVILRFFVEIWGLSDFIVRLPATLIGVLTIPVMYQTGKVLVNRHVGLLSAFLLAISSMHITYSQEAHGYTLFTVLSLLGFYHLWKALHNNQWFNWVAFAIVIGLAINTHLYSVFVLFTCLIIGFVFMYSANKEQSSDNVWHRFKLNRVNLLLSFGILTLLIVPITVRFVVPNVLQISGLSAENTYADRSARFDITPELFITGYRQLAGWQSEPTEAIYILFSCLFFIGLIYLWLRKKQLFFAIIIWLVVPILPIVVFALVIGFSFAARRIIFMLPIYLLTISVGIYGLIELFDYLVPADRALHRYPRLGIYALGLLLLIMVSQEPLSRYYRVEKNDWKRTALLLEKMTTPNDLILSPTNARPFLKYYFDQPGQTIVAVPENAQLDALTAIPAERVWYIYRPLGNESTTFSDIRTIIGNNKDILHFSFGGNIKIAYMNNNVDSEDIMYQEWVRILQQAIEIRPGHWYLYDMLLNLYLQQENHEAAIKLSTHYSQTIDPDDIRPHLMLAKIYAVNGQLNMSISQLKPIIEQTPQNPLLYKTLNEIFAFSTDSEKTSASLLQQLEAIDPVVAHYGLGFYYAQHKQPELAAAEFQTALAIDRHHPVALLAQEQLAR